MSYIHTKLAGFIAELIRSYNEHTEKTNNSKFTTGFTSRL